MKKINKYSFLILLIITVIVAAPFVIKKLAGHSADNSSVTGSAAESASAASNQSIPPQPESVFASSGSVSSLTSSAVPANTDADFFNDALFIGDSRTVGLSEYGKIKGATFFASTGMSVYKVLKETVSVPSVGKMRLDALLSRKEYGKIYIMLGINELGYNLNATIGKYEELISSLRRLEPNARIYILANLHVTKKRSDSDKIFTNANINRFNQSIAQLADDTSVFYLDMNLLFDDSDGNLRAEDSGDGIHLHAKRYAEWGPWLQSQAAKN